jgi:hypothetical protein
MKFTYAPGEGAGPTYEIDADRHGNYEVRLEGRVIKRVSSVTNYFGKPRWGSKALQDRALEEARAVIDSHHATQQG